MKRRLAGVALLLAPVAVAVVAGAAEPTDPDDLATLLADLEASGGIVTTDDLAVLVGPPPAPSHGAWSLAFTGRPGAPPRVDLLAEQHGERWAGRVRGRRDGAQGRWAGWLRGGASGWRLDLGCGAVAHGAGLLAAAPGRRSSLAADASLMPSRPGWCASTATAPGTSLRGGAVRWRHRWVTVAAGTGRQDGGPSAGFWRAVVGPPDLRLAGLVIRRAGGRGVGVDLAWRREAWRLVAEADRWHGAGDGRPGHAWHLAAAWRRGRWRMEAQAAASEAFAGLAGARRPACLPGWRGRGWALRVAGSPVAGLRAAALVSIGEHRDPETAGGTRRRRSLVAAQVRGGGRGRPAWELRLRRTDETSSRFDPLQPWLPAAETGRRQRTWLVAAVTVPGRAGEMRAAWRWLGEAGAGRHLATASWRGVGRRGRWRAGVQLAWGDPLDLVSVSAPVSGQVRLRHWGHWQSGMFAGAETAGTWRWRGAVELRRRSLETGGDVVAEVFVALGRSW